MVSFELQARFELRLIGTETFMAQMDYTIGLEDGVKGVLEKEIKEIHDSDDELCKEDTIDLNLTAKVPKEGMIFDTLNEAKWCGGDSGLWAGLPLLYALETQLACGRAGPSHKGTFYVKA
ncbi:hypothetical protein Scep_023400 [Stephania cephalantha]|uniref:Uncharacterized protein n=1 Tax=Stephania cephalantha TaxID=152367 RepID=A0AAP0EUN3_9MAGN